MGFIDYIVIATLLISVAFLIVSGKNLLKNRLALVLLVLAIIGNVITWTVHFYNK